MCLVLIYLIFSCCTKVSLWISLIMASVYYGNYSLETKRDKLELGSFSGAENVKLL